MTATDRTKLEKQEGKGPMTEKITDKPNSPAWLIATNLEQKRSLIRTRLDDIARAQASIAQAEVDIAEYDLALRAIRALPEATP